MLGIIGGRDGDGDTYCLSCMENDTLIREIATHHIPTMEKITFTCFHCGRKVENEPHLEAAKTKPKPVTLNFCAHCGVLLHHECTSEGICTNCGGDVSQPIQRIEGTFTLKEAHALEAILFGEPVSMEL